MHKKVPLAPDGAQNAAGLSEQNPSHRQFERGGADAATGRDRLDDLLQAERLSGQMGDAGIRDCAGRRRAAARRLFCCYDT